MPFCAYCGKEISDRAPSCPQCGHPGPGAQAVAPPSAAKPVEGVAIAALACSVSGFVILPFVGSILGIVFAGVAKRRLAEDPSVEGASMVRAATIIGWVGLALFTLFTIGLIVFLVFVDPNNVIIGPHRVRGI